MKRLVLLGEGHGEVDGLPILARKFIADKNASEVMFVDKDVVRAHNATGLVTWSRENRAPDFSEWLRYLKIAARRRDMGAILAVFDGDAAYFPAGSRTQFCAANAAKQMAQAAVSEGAGKMFSLVLVFACVEFESWIIASAENLIGQKLDDQRTALPLDTRLPAGDPESHGKGWLERNCPGYRPTRDQGAMTKLIDLNVVRSKNLRSFRRLDRAFDQIISALSEGKHICSPP